MESEKVASLESVLVQYERLNANEEPRAILANFPSVIPAKNAESSAFEYLKNTNRLNKAKASQRKLVVSTGANVTYEGSVHNPLNPPLVKHYIGVYNRKKNKLVIHNAHLINMHLRSDEKPIEKHEKLEHKERNDLLIQAFGSVKKRRAIENNKRNHEFKKSVSSTIGFAFGQVDKESLEVKDVTAANPILEYIPNFCADASLADDVFPWSNLISEQEMDALISPAGAFVESTVDQVEQWTNNNTYPRFILKRLAYLPSEVGERHRRSNFLMYTNYLMHLFKLKNRDLKKRDILPVDTPPLLTSSILNKFTSPMADHKFARNMSMKQRDCLLYHTLVACLKLDHCDILLADLKDDLKARDLVKYYRMMGCRIVPGKPGAGIPAKDNLRVRLVVPYVLPDPPRNKGEKRKRQ